MTFDIERLKRRHPIEQVVTAHGVALRRSGTHLVGRCPFHRDSHPSLVVYPETRSFFCFGCRAGGDVIDFVRRADGLGFREAVEWLGGTRHVPVAEPGADDGLTPDDRLVLAAACELYHASLMESRTARSYLAARGVDLDLARRCRVGYGEGTALRGYLERRRFGLRRARNLGLIDARGRETMAGRIVIPELRGGQCIWLVGRALDEGRRPKYWGVARPKPVLGYEQVAASPCVILTEGPFDYLTGLAWGLPVCALVGTHAPTERLAFLAHARRIVLAFDSDKPGQSAAAALARRLGARARVLPLPADVKDLNELGQRPDGRATFLQLLADVDPDDEREQGGGDAAHAH